jgi:rhodanese-related sulfurtransferase
MATMTRDTTRPTIAPDELARQLSDAGGVQVLDVRTPAEFETAHIEGSYNLPLDQLPAYCGALSGGNSPLVLVCSAGTRAAEADRALRAAGCQRTRVLEGGLTAWERAALPLVRGRERWAMERQVRGVAGSIVLAGAIGGLFVWRPLTAVAAAIGGGLVFSALTNTCTMARVLGRLPYNQGAAGSDPAATVRALTE